MRCGFYETEITPPLGTTIFGYYARRVNVGVSSKLYAKACVLEQDGKHCAMLVLDTLAVPASFPAFIRQYVHEKTGIDPREVQLLGKPGQAIAQYAKQAQLDMLVLGSHGYGRFMSAVMGSTAMRIASMAEIPLLVVR